MEDNLEKTFLLLNKWLELKRIPREKQEEYYYRLILSLEEKEEILRRRLLCFTTGGMALSASIPCFLLRQDSFDTVLALFLLIYGVIVGTIPFNMEEKQYLEEYTEVEDSRERIKKICSKKKIKNGKDHQ